MRYLWSCSCCLSVRRSPPLPCWDCSGTSDRYLSGTGGETEKEEVTVHSGMWPAYVCKVKSCRWPTSFSHGVMQSLWKRWVHGRGRAWSFSLKGSLQIEHSVSEQRNGSTGSKYTNMKDRKREREREQKRPPDKSSAPRIKVGRESILSCSAGGGPPLSKSCSSNCWVVLGEPGIHSHNQQQEANGKDSPVWQCHLAMAGCQKN